MARLILTTPRLALREFEPGDAASFVELNSDPEVLRYTGDKPFESVEAARSVRKLEEAGRAKLRGRLERIAAEAARQARTPRVATIDGPLSLDEGLLRARPPETLRVFFDPTGAAPLFELLRGAPTGTPLAFAVGPEGGFTGEERARAVALGWLPARFGTTVLRTETMAAAVLGAVRAFDDADERAP